MVVAWTLSANPSDNYLECNGQVVDSTKYPKLYQLMHNVPDYRGMFLRGLGGNSADLGELQNYALIEHTHEITMPASHGKAGNGGIPRFSDGDVWSNNKTKLTTGITDDIPIANEVRPINKAVRYFIKAK
ncbi:MAG: phage tail protein [Megamonas funiformis]|uniref:phage tail protein n=1 Tax=Megamonas funiformis TaxID=437897 RepID=UPI002A7FAB1B|nr:phage tail protein [Megamonas funiformis]MDY3873891.1 phage tail protein [Megamonas funiformis]